MRNREQNHAAFSGIPSLITAILLTYSTAENWPAAICSVTVHRIMSVSARYRSIQLSL